MANNFNITELRFQQAIRNVLGPDFVNHAREGDDGVGWKKLHETAMLKCFAEYAGSADDQYVLRAMQSVLTRTGWYEF